MQLFALDWAVISCVLLLLIASRRRAKRVYENPKGLPLPPGPKPLPVLGNVNEVKHMKNWHDLLRRAAQFGKLCIKCML